MASWMVESVASTAAAMRAIKGIIDAKGPTSGAVEQAAKLKTLEVAFEKMFPAGSDKGDTKAKPEIWTEMDKFKAAATKMQDEMAKLNVAAKSGNLDAI